MECEVRVQHYDPQYYQAICDFFIALNQGSKAHMNWNWARWEWGFFHPEFDRSLEPYIGIWLDGRKVIGMAAFDMYFGEAFCGVLPGYESTLPFIVDYAVENLSDENGVGIAVNEKDTAMSELLLSKGFTANAQWETMLRIDLSKDLKHPLPTVYSIREITFPLDSYPYQLVLWKGFDHGDNMAEFEQSLQTDILLHPHGNPKLTLAVTDHSGNFLAHCGCWYAPETDYAYVEPVCVVPEYRGKGIGKAVVSEALNRCRALGAKEAYVLSDQIFYKRLGFENDSNHRFFRKNRGNQ